MKHVVIIGGGFSGTLAAVNLARLCGGPLKITIINSGFPMGRGVAYSTRNGNHLLNVAARNMSALADQPNHFVEWLRTRSEYYAEPMTRVREEFVPRRTYGDYIHSLLLFQTGAAAERKVQLETVAAEAVDMVPADWGATVHLSDGHSIHANRVILATGNQAPSVLKLKGLNPAHPKYFANPWIDWENQLTDPTLDIMLIGTGLTMIDAFVSLKDLGWRGKIHAISRNGLLPLSHFKAMEYSGLVDESAEKIGLKKLFHNLKEQSRHARTQNINPAVLVDKLRPFTQRIWQNFSLRDKKRFSRHFRTRWNVVRHRIAQSLHQQLEEAIANDRLEIIKGRLMEFEESGTSLTVKAKSRGETRRIECGGVINCTGPRESYSKSASPLFVKLFERGLVQADEMDMGIRVTPEFVVVDKNGQQSRFLCAVGPLLKGTLWESSAVPELRSQTFRLAESLAKDLSGKQNPSIHEAVQVVLEYEI